jgi:hypothetical protein
MMQRRMELWIMNWHLGEGSVSRLPYFEEWRKWQRTSVSVKNHRADIWTGLSNRKQPRITICFFVCGAPVQLGPIGRHIVEVYTQPHLRWDSSEREISSSHRLLPTQGYEPRDSRNKRLQTYALDCTVAGIGTGSYLLKMHAKGS